MEPTKLQHKEISKAVYGRAIRQVRPTQLKKWMELNNIFQKKIKFGRVIPAL